MRILFLSDVILNDRGHALPAIAALRDGPTGNFAASWTITTFQDPRRVSIGIAEVTPDQIAVIEAEPGIAVMELSPGWKLRRWNRFGIEKRRIFFTKAEDRGLTTARIRFAA